ncbi:hypothetical protein TNCV_83031 [Trichonephila clavipes]|nr:hypothetical protein TNCV_83031 [Trichonephila clavipes]
MRSSVSLRKRRGKEPKVFAFTIGRDFSILRNWTRQVMRRRLGTLAEQLDESERDPNEVRQGGKARFLREPNCGALPPNWITSFDRA